MFPDLIVEQVIAAEPPVALTAIQVENPSAQPVVIYGGGFLVVLLLMIACVICAVEMVKRIWKASVAHEGKRYRRVVPALPFLLGILVGAVFGQKLMLQISLIVEVWHGALLVGPAVGGLSMAAFTMLKRWIVPGIVTVAPTLVRAAIMKGISFLSLDIDKEDLPDISIERVNPYQEGLVEETEEIGPLWPFIILLISVALISGLIIFGVI